jgi:ABC-type nickel/cobalt efflux system permease component RcnA
MAGSRHGKSLSRWPGEQAASKKTLAVNLVTGLARCPVLLFCISISSERWHDRT